MIETLEQLDLLHELPNFRLRQTFQSDLFDCNRLACRRIERVIDRPEVSFADALAKFLIKNRRSIRH
jgi:hypothetical protein